MRSEVCRHCKFYDGNNCRTDYNDPVPIQIVFQCGIADQILEGEPNEGQR